MSNDTNNRLNIHHSQGDTNSLEGSEFYGVMIDTCNHIARILIDHCGPYATDALIIQDNTGNNLKDTYYATFTKDGIGIVRAIEFASPIQKQIQNLIAYVGGRVDTLSHDGTTTAMLCFTLLIARFFEQIRNTIASGQLPDIRATRREFLSIINDLSVHLEKDLVVTVEKIAADCGISFKDAIKMVAYYQSMLSSKGDVELSDAIVDVVETLPKELYGLFSVSQSGVETNKRFTIVHDNFTFRLPVQANPDDFNHRMGTEYKSDDCDLLVSEDDLVRGNPALDVLVKHIYEAETGNIQRDLVVIAKSVDSSFIGRINVYNRSHQHKIIIFPMSLYNQYSSKVTTLSALMAVASVYSINDHIINPELPYLIKSAKVHYRYRRLEVNNLYTKDGSQYHPSFTDRTRFIPYTLMVDTIKEELDVIASGRVRIENASDRDRYTDYVEIYRRMISSDVRNLQLSGMRHDTMADRDVLMDSFGAVLSSLEKGFVFDGYLKFYLFLKDNTNTTAVTITDVIDCILSYVHKGDANKGVVFDKKLYSVSNGYVITDPNKNAQFIKYLYYPVDGEPGSFLDQLRPEIDIRATQLPVIQPADTYRELFKRLIDLVPKLLNTNRVMIPGTVNTKEKS